MQQGVNFLFRLFVKLIELTVRDFFSRQEIFYFSRIPLDEDVNGSSEVFGDIFRIVVLPFLLDS
jgi:hypothetical protein